MNRAGGPEFAIDIRISTLKTLLAKINIVFHADITGFPVRMIDTVAHFKSPIFLMTQVL